jgi:hypothetical protein
VYLVKANLTDDTAASEIDQHPLMHYWLWSSVPLPIDTLANVVSAKVEHIDTVAKCLISKSRNTVSLLQLKLCEKNKLIVGRPVATR